MRSSPTSWPTIRAGVQASASLPLYQSDGTVLGALAFAWTDPTVFNPKLEAALRAVGVLCVETVERAERYDADHELVVAMQRRLLGDLPSLPRIETAARYLPATASLAVGGDWYEGLVLGNTRMALVVGDITGHGIAAAADMALVGWSVPSSTPGWQRRTCSPNCPLSSANAALSSSPPPPWSSSTSRQDTVTFATAGHPRRCCASPMARSVAWTLPTHRSSASPARPGCGHRAVPEGFEGRDVHRRPDGATGPPGR